jgi:hypothetical protein
MLMPIGEHPPMCRTPSLFFTAIPQLGHARLWALICQGPDGGFGWEAIAGFEWRIDISL